MEPRRDDRRKCSQQSTTVHELRGDRGKIVWSPEFGATFEMEEWQLWMDTQICLQTVIVDSSVPNILAAAIRVHLRCLGAAEVCERMDGVYTDIHISLLLLNLSLVTE